MRKAQALRGALHFRLCRGSKTSGATFLSWAKLDVTMLVISQDPEHQDLSYVYSGSVDRFRPPVTGGLQACLLRTDKRRSGSPSALGVGWSPLRLRGRSGKKDGTLLS